MSSSSDSSSDYDGMESYEIPIPGLDPMARASVPGSVVTAALSTTGEVALVGNTEAVRFFTIRHPSSRDVTQRTNAGPESSHDPKNGVNATPASDPRTTSTTTSDDEPTCVETKGPMTLIADFPRPAEGSWVCSALSPCGKYAAAVCHGSFIQIYEARNGHVSSEVENLDGDDVTEFSRKLDTIARVPTSFAETISVPIAKDSDVLSITFVPSPQKIAAGTEDMSTGMSTGAPRKTAPLCAVSGQSFDLKLLNILTGSWHPFLHDASNDGLLNPHRKGMPPPQEAADQLRDVCFSPDGSVAVVSLSSRSAADSAAVFYRVDPTSGSTPSASSDAGAALPSYAKSQDALPLWDSCCSSLQCVRVVKTPLHGAFASGEDGKHPESAIRTQMVASAFCHASASVYEITPNQLAAECVDCRNADAAHKDNDDDSEEETEQREQATAEQDAAVCFAGADFADGEHRYVNTAVWVPKSAEPCPTVIDDPRGCFLHGRARKAHQAHHKVQAIPSADDASATQSSSCLSEQKPIAKAINAAGASEESLSDRALSRYVAHAASYVSGTLSELQTKPSGSKRLHPICYLMSGSRCGACDGTVAAANGIVVVGQGNAVAVFDARCLVDTEGWLRGTIGNDRVVPPMLLQVLAAWFDVTTLPCFHH